MDELDEVVEQQPLTPEEAPLPALPNSLSSAAVFASPPMPEPPTSMDDITKDVLALTESDVLDKATALRVFRIYHAMDVLIRHEKHVRDRQISDLRNDLERARLEMELERFARQHTLMETQMQQVEVLPRQGRSVRR